jgi:hypothetical protein
MALAARLADAQSFVGGEELVPAGLDAAELSTADVVGQMLDVDLDPRAVASPLSAISAPFRPDRDPRSSRYDPRWVIALEMGPHRSGSLKTFSRRSRTSREVGFSISAAAAAQPPSSSPASVG